MSKKTLEPEHPVFDRNAWENRKYAEKCWYEYPDKPDCLRVLFYGNYMLIGVKYPGEYPRGNEYCYVEYNDVQPQFKANCNAAFRMCWEKSKLAGFTESSKKSF